MTWVTAHPAAATLLVLLFTWLATAVPIYFNQKSTKDEWAHWAVEYPRYAGLLMIAEALGLNSAKLFRGLAMLASGNPFPAIAQSVLVRAPASYDTNAPRPSDDVAPPPVVIDKASSGSAKGDVP